MKIKQITVVLLLLALGLGACSKYEEGPAFSLYSKGKRIQGRWYFSRVLYNETDSSETYYDDYINFSTGDGSKNDWGIFTWVKNPMANSEDAIELGGWTFSENKDSIEMVILDKHPALYDTIHWRITRLAYDEWWMERHLDENTLIKWELWKWVY